MTEKKTPKVIFDPGCFDNLEVESQEELDELMASITSMFEGKTEEEIRAMSRPVDIDELMEEDPELAKILINQMSNEPRKLQ